MQTFVDAEDAYLARVGRHTDGYVLNAGRTEAPSTSVVLHKRYVLEHQRRLLELHDAGLHQGLLAGSGRVGTLGWPTRAERVPQLPLLPRLMRR